MGGRGSQLDRQLAQAQFQFLVRLDVDRCGRGRGPRLCVEQVRGNIETGRFLNGAEDEVAGIEGLAQAPPGGRIVEHIAHADAEPTHVPRTQFTAVDDLVCRGAEVVREVVGSQSPSSGCTRPGRALTRKLKTMTRGRYTGRGDHHQGRRRGQKGLIQVGITDHELALPCVHHEQRWRDDDRWRRRRRQERSHALARRSCTPALPPDRARANSYWRWASRCRPRRKRLSPSSNDKASRRPRGPGSSTGGWTTYATWGRSEPVRAGGAGPRKPPRREPRC